MSKAEPVHLPSAAAADGEEPVGNFPTYVYISKSFLLYLPGLRLNVLSSTTEATYHMKLLKLN